MTCNRTQAPNADENGSNEEPRLPPLQYHIVEALYKKFRSIIKGSVDLTLYETKFATRELIKRVSDVVWNSLTRSYYKDRAHLQSLFSYLTGNKLDCFGVAFAVVAGCQVLGFSDVHLALSEDHAWVVFGENSSNTAEVTWHGKGSEDKRGQSIDVGVSSRSWLYVNGFPVLCDRQMEVAALVSAMNPSLSVTSDSVEVALLQQQLLWLLYDMSHLDKYPMAIGNLAELEEIKPSPGRVPCATLLQQGIQTARKYYNNMHVYPYTYQAGYFYRHNLYKQAFKSWANASDVIRQYNYSRDDEEIYKEVMEIANELIPHIMKVVSSGHCAHSILKDAECFADLLRFYDGICQWEEGSQTPVLHIGWAKPLVNTISKFDSVVRSQVIILNHETVVDVSLLNNNNDCCKTQEILNDLESKITKESSLHPKIKALTAACGERILNKDFLLQGGGEPFVETTTIPSTSAEDFKFEKSQPTLILHSQKMRGLKDLLLSEKLNTHAISLQLTAQSQVQFGKKGSLRDDAVSSRTKRTRRD
ncbi:hypothetical protein AAG570_003709 [Ranatra chinensis]|uniref:Menin n=1 Tax=Ranatra chinensis TaxID=642074 RepID=A0ABD0Y5K9_9HEMI